MRAALRSLRYRNARLFFIGLLVSNIGTWIQFTVLALVVYRLSGRAIDLGITVALQFLPMLVIGAWAGAFADRHDKRRLAIVTQAALAAHALALGVLELSGLLDLRLIFGLSFVLGVINAFDNPARRGFATELVEPVDISNVMSLNTAVMTGSRIFGPAIAAVLIGPVGSGWLFLVNGLSFAAIIVSLLAIDTKALYRVPLAPAGGRPVRDGLSFIRRTPVLLNAFIVFALVSTFGFNYSVALPKIADRHWGGDHWFGWMLTVVAVGSVIGSLLTARLSRVTYRWMMFNGAVLGVAGVIMAWSPSLVVAALIGVPLGVGGAAFIASMSAISQQYCPATMRGRVLALTAVAFLGSTPIGGPVTGWVGDHIGARWSLGYGALLTLAAVAAGSWWQMRRPVSADDAARSTLAS